MPRPSAWASAHVSGVTAAQACVGWLRALCGPAACTPPAARPARQQEGQRDSQFRSRHGCRILPGVIVCVQARAEIAAPSYTEALHRNPAALSEPQRRSPRHWRACPARRQIRRNAVEFLRKRGHHPSDASHTTEVTGQSCRSVPNQSPCAEPLALARTCERHFLLSRRAAPRFARRQSRRAQSGRSEQPGARHAHCPVLNGRPCRDGVCGCMAYGCSETMCLSTMGLVLHENTVFPTQTKTPGFLHWKAQEQQFIDLGPGSPVVMGMLTNLPDTDPAQFLQIAAQGAALSTHADLWRWLQGRRARHGWRTT